MTADYDVFIIGAGQAGPPLARALAKAGRRVGLAERKHMGGSCVNFGCTPTKAAFASARMAHLARRAGEYGVRVPSVEVDFTAVLERAQGIVAQSVAGLERQFSGTDSGELIRGHARFEGRQGVVFRLVVGERAITATQVVVDTGTRNLVPSIEGLEDIDFLDADHWLEHKLLPQRLLIVGGGYVGLEMAQFYRRMGAEVIVAHAGPQIAEHEDADVAAALQHMLEQEDIRFLLEHHAKHFSTTAAGVRTTLEAGGRQQDIETSHVFVAVGRKPNTDDLGFDTVGVKLSDKGIVEVDERLATSTPGIWAVGDIRGGPMFTHTAWDDYRIVRSQLAGDRARTTDRIVPYAMFTDPELGRVGMTEGQARKAGKKIRVGHFDLSGNGKAREIGEAEGFVKVIIDDGSEQILGAAVLGVHGAELVHMYVDLMNAGASYAVLRDAIHIHPTLAEAIQSAVADL
ncbi:MAG: mercuric reductase [Pseudomonadota bacterium]|nr:mercuric reductase [Pseudomonadota bacterium]